MNRKIIAPALGLIFANAVLFAGATIRGKVRISGLRDNANALVYIATAKGSFAPPAQHPAMNQISLSFQPRVLPIVVGTTVDFNNNDEVQHNVFTPSPAGDLFNLGTWEKGKSKSHTFKKPGRVDVLCNVHSEMKAFILVLQNPYFAVTDKDGNYQIPDVPAGSYVLKVWHERATASPQNIQVSNGPINASFDLSVK